MNDAHSLLSSRRGWLKTAGGVAAGAALGGLSLLPRRARAAGTATILPIDGWLAAQGQSFGQIPPSANFADWFSRIATLQEAKTPPVLVATVDYAGLENQAFGNAFGTTVDKQSSKVLVQPLNDGSGDVSVRVLLYTQNANTWVIPLTIKVPGQFPPDFSQQLVNNQVLFGFRPCNICSTPGVTPPGVKPSGACLGNSFLDITYITTPDNLFVDLLAAAGLQTANFRSQATGPFTSYYLSVNGLPTGTLGRCTVSQTGFITSSTNSHSRVALDAFPAELVDLQVLG